MCGLGAIIIKENKNKNLYKSKLLNMSNLISHRGPDQAGFLEYENILLSHLRLPVMDPRNLGRQPMSVDNRYSIIFNGDDTYTLYLGNYNIVGPYVSDTVSNTITFYDSDNDIIGTVSEINIDTISQNLNAFFDFPSLFDSSNSDAELDNNYDSTYTYIPDDYFEQYLIDKGLDDILDDYVKTSNLLNECCIGVDPPDICQIPPFCENDEFYDFENRFEWRISNLSGIEDFPNLFHINLIGNKIDSINLTKNPELENFYANFNTFNKIDTSNNTLLEIISIDSNEVNPELDFSNNNNLNHINNINCFFLQFFFKQR